MKLLVVLLFAAASERASASIIQHQARQAAPTIIFSGTITSVPVATPPPTRVITSVTTISSPTTVRTPSPTQPGLIPGCDEFYYVQPMDRCDVIGPRLGLTTAQIVAWNPSVLPDCTGLWANVFLCVSIAGHETRPQNAIATPRPVIPGMTLDCEAFAEIQPFDNCGYFVEDHGLTMEQFLRWNPGLGPTCQNFWEGFNVCVRTIGFVPTPTTPPNGVVTPRPVQDGMVSNCKTFHFVEYDETCVEIAWRYGISTVDFVRWNPGVGGSCESMWAHSYVCVALL